MILFCESIGVFFRALHRYMSCDDPGFRFRHASLPGLTVHIFYQWHSQYSDPMMFCQYPAARQNTVSGFSYLLSISIQPGIREYALLSYPFRNDLRPISFLTSSSRNDLLYKTPREDQASSRDDCKQQNNRE